MQLRSLCERLLRKTGRKTFSPKVRGKDLNYVFHAKTGTD
jgi:hypothetical protein